MPKLPEKHFPLQDPELERTDLYYFEGDKQKPMILFGLRGPGGFDCLWPVILQLQGDDYPLDLLIDSRAKERLLKRKSNFKKLPEGSPLKRIMELEPSVVVTEFSADDGLGLVLEWSEKGYGVPVVCVEDYPGSTATAGSLKIDPDFLCVFDERTKGITEINRPGMSPGSIVATGNPAFDEYLNINPQILRKVGRERCGVSDEEFLIVFAGQLPPQTPQMLNHVVEELNNTFGKSFVFLFAKHPRDTNSRGFYERLLGKFQGRVIFQEEVDERTGHGCDLLITMTSTQALRSCFRRVPLVQILPKELNLGLDYSPSDYPPLAVVTKAAFVCNSFENLGETLKEAILDKVKRQERVEIMEREFLTDGKNTQRVVEVIKGAINK